MPETNSAAQDFTSIINQLCEIDVAEGVQPSPDLEASVLNNKGSLVVLKDLLQKLLIYLMETIDEITEARNAMQEWKSLFSRSTLETFLQLVTRSLQIPTKEYVGLKAEESSRLDILAQVASFAYFMKNKENDAAYGDTRAQIRHLQRKIMQFGRILRQLLPLTNEDIRNYLMQDNVDYTRVLERVSTKESIRRAICCIGVELFLNTLKKIRVSVDASSVVMV